MKSHKQYLKEQMKDPTFAETYNREKDIIAELVSMPPKERVKRAEKAAAKEIGTIKRTKKKKLS